MFPDPYGVLSGVCIAVSHSHFNRNRTFLSFILVTLQYFRHPSILAITRYVHPSVVQ
jgi:hypothetical protein